MLDSKVPYPIHLAPRHEEIISREMFFMFELQSLQNKEYLDWNIGSLK